LDIKIPVPQDKWAASPKMPLPDMCLLEMPDSEKSSGNSGFSSNGKDCQMVLGAMIYSLLLRSLPVPAVFMPSSPM